MKYCVERNTSYDFSGESYATSYPNLHNYPATMLPQIGIKLFQDFNVKKGNLLDPYCGSGSSFASALEFGINEMFGFDINPLAVLISKTKFTKVDMNSLSKKKAELRNSIFNFIKDKSNVRKLKPPAIVNIDYWFSKDVIQKLNILRRFIFEIEDHDLKNFFLLPFSKTIRICSYTRNQEFKLYRMKEQDILNFNPDVFEIYFKNLSDIMSIYSNSYFPKLTEKTRVTVSFSKFISQPKYFDLVLTSPPYGDSRTTVAYGQFSTLTNEWTGIDYARKIDSMLMGGKKAKNLFSGSIIDKQIEEIAKQDRKRALEVSAFYQDLGNSIDQVSYSIKNRGKIFYIVGNRTVKGVQLKTDQFIAERFEKNSFRHVSTIERTLRNKVMPSKSSPTNKKGKTVNTMLSEYIIYCEKV